MLLYPHIPHRLRSPRCNISPLLCWIEHGGWQTVSWIAEQTQMDVPHLLQELFATFYSTMLPFKFTGLPTTAACRVTPVNPEVYVCN